MKMRLEFPDFVEVKSPIPGAVLFEMRKRKFKTYVSFVPETRFLTLYYFFVELLWTTGTTIPQFSLNQRIRARHGAIRLSQLLHRSDELFWLSSEPTLESLKATSAVVETEVNEARDKALARIPQRVDEALLKLREFGIPFLEEKARHHKSI